LGSGDGRPTICIEFLEFYCIITIIGQDDSVPQSGGIMSQKGNTTEEALGYSLKKLILKMPFEKITIRDITDEAGLMRPTFYNHFKDKYDLLEWIFVEEIVRPAKALIESNMMEEAVHLMLKRMEMDLDFYKKAVRIQGQNSFQEIIFQTFRDIMKKVLEEKMEGKSMANRLLTPESMAEYYAAISSFVIIRWIKTEWEVTPQEVAQAYAMLVATPLDEMIREL
jgi:probable dihydroxyacetone kinase regulator